MIHQHQFRSLHYTFSDSAVTVVVIAVVVTAFTLVIVISVIVTAVTTVSVMAVAVVPTVAVAVVLLQ